MVKRWFVLVVFIVLAGAAQAMLPPDASVREPEISAYRRQVREAYEERIQKRQERATREYKKATAAIGVPPWELDRVWDGQSDKKIQAEVLQQPKIENKKAKKRILVSIVLLAVIGSAVGWVKHVTSEDRIS